MLQVLELGSFNEPMEFGAVLQQFEMPPAKIPSTVFAQGRYRTKITYSAKENAKLRYEEVEFSVVPAGS